MKSFREYATMMPMNEGWLSTELERLGLRYNPLLAEFEEDLYKQNEVMNLTRVPREECDMRHFLDSVLISPLIPPGSEVLDIGTGPGFPAWPLALLRPDLKVTALDSSGKMLGFLQRHPLPNLLPVQGRAEDNGWDEEFDVVTGRALAPFPAQVELSVRPCRRGGFLLPMRTPGDASTIEAFPFEKLGLILESCTNATLSAPPVLGEEAMSLPLTSDFVQPSPAGGEGDFPTPCLSPPSRLYPRIVKLKKTPAGYPRQWAEIKRRPLA